MSLLSFEPFLRDDIYVCIYHFRIRLSQTFCISASYADLSLSKNFFSRHLSPDKTRKSHLDFPNEVSSGRSVLSAIIEAESLKIEIQSPSVSEDVNADKKKVPPYFY